MRHVPDMEDGMAAQHLEALEKAQQIRLARSALKRKVADGRLSVADVLRDVPPEARNMTAFDLLATQHRWARHRARQALAQVPVPESKTLGAMTPRQRAALAAIVRP